MRQRTNTAPTPKLMYARHRGVCKCGRGFIAGEQIEFDPISRNKRCARCIEKRLQVQPNSANGQLLHFDSYRGVIQRLRTINSMARPLAPHVVNEYWRLMRDISTAPETSKSVKEFLETTARCCSPNDAERFAVSLSEERECVHCFEPQKIGEMVLMDFPNRNVHCIWCACTRL